VVESTNYEALHYAVFSSVLFVISSLLSPKISLLNTLFSDTWEKNDTVTWRTRYLGDIEQYGAERRTII
jgi:hypothetical protein